MLRDLRSDQGVKRVDFGVTLLVIGLLAALAVPGYLSLRNAADDLAFQSGERAEVITSTADGGKPDVGVDTVEVAGARLERAADGATCLWTRTGGDTFAVWEKGSLQLYGTFDAPLEVCPTEAQAVAAGFGPTP